MHCKLYLSQLLQLLQLLIIIVRILTVVLQYELRKGKMQTEIYAQKKQSRRVF